MVKASAEKIRARVQAKARGQASSSAIPRQSIPPTRPSVPQPRPSTSQAGRGNTTTAPSTEDRGKQKVVEDTRASPLLKRKRPSPSPRGTKAPSPDKTGAEPSKRPSLMEGQLGGLSLKIGRKVTLSRDQEIFENFNGRLIESHLHDWSLKISSMATFLGRSLDQYRSGASELLQKSEALEDAVEAARAKNDKLKAQLQSLESEYLRKSKEVESSHELELAIAKSESYAAGKDDYISSEANQTSLLQARTSGFEDFKSSSEFSSIIAERENKAVDDFKESEAFEDVVADEAAGYLRTGFFRCQGQCLLNPAFPKDIDWSFLDPAEEVHVDGVTEEEGDPPKFFDEGPGNIPIEVTGDDTPEGIPGDDTRNEL